MAIRATKPATPAAVADAAAGRSTGEELAGAATVPPEAPSDENERIPPDTMVSERYRIARVLGEGGMGVVYAAEHVLMRKEVALKVLHADMCSVPEVVARFEREAIAAAHIDHPNVAAATDFGRLPDGSCYLVLELLRGTSLRDEIKKGPIPLRRALHILRGIASGVSAAHVKGIVHRDLKPENVMLVERDGGADFVKVLDFGIAKVDPTVALAPQAGTSKVLTRVGSVFGTPEYMSPEQAVGDSVDARTDLYALGVILLEMLTGKCPFEGNPLSILRERILAVGPPEMSGVTDPGARALVAKLLARQPEDRMQTAAELIAAIDALLDERTTGSIPPPGVSSPSPLPTPEPSAPTARGRWLLPAAVAAALGITVAGYGVVRALGRPNVEPEQTPTTTATATATATAPPNASPVPEPPPADTDTEESPPPAASTGAPAPAPSAASARAPRRGKPPSKPSRPPPQKKTGPGGIYVPPPKDWFK